LGWVLGLTSLSDRRDRHSRRGLLREPGDHGNQWRPLGR
jgi:hypothetical protein